MHGFKGAMWTFLKHESIRSPNEKSKQQKAYIYQNFMAWWPLKIKVDGQWSWGYGAFRVREQLGKRFVQSKLGWVFHDYSRRVRPDSAHNIVTRCFQYLLDQLSTQLSRTRELNVHY